MADAPSAAALLKAEDLRPVLELRSLLEGHAVNLLRRRGSPADWIVRLRAFLPELETHALHGDHEAFHRADMRLHRHLLELSGVPALLACWETVLVPSEAWVAEVKRACWPSLMALYREHVFLLNAWASVHDEVAGKATALHIEAGWHRVQAANGGANPDANPVDRAAAFIATHFGNPLNAAWIARHVSHVSPRHLARLFQEQRGLSVLGMIRQVRMERAAEFLAAGELPLGAVARHCGYPNLSHFSTDFRKYFGVPPTRYRKSPGAAKRNCQPSGFLE